MMMIPTATLNSIATAMVFSGHCRYSAWDDEFLDNLEVGTVAISRATSLKFDWVLDMTGGDDDDDGDGDSVLSF